MTHDEAMIVASEVEEAIKDLKHLYLSIIIKSSGERQVIIRKKGANNG